MRDKKTDPSKARLDASAAAIERQLDKLDEHYGERMRARRDRRREDEIKAC